MRYPTSEYKNLIRNPCKLKMLCHHKTISVKLGAIAPNLRFFVFTQFKIFLISIRHFYFLDSPAASGVSLWRDIF